MLELGCGHRLGCNAMWNAWFRMCRLFQFVSLAERDDRKLPFLDPEEFFREGCNIIRRHASGIDVPDRGAPLGRFVDIRCAIHH